VQPKRAAAQADPAAKALRQDSEKAAQRKDPKTKTPILDPVVIDALGFRDLLTRHRGKPVMVNFWATWCEPCRDEYPMVNQLARTYGPQGLVVVGISLDDDAEMGLVRRFLARMNPIFPNYRKKPGNDEPFMNSVSPEWSGAIPATFFYDRDGQQRARLVGEHNRAAFEKAIQDLLRSPGGVAPAGAADAARRTPEK